MALKVNWTKILIGLLTLALGISLCYIAFSSSKQAAEINAVYHAGVELKMQQAAEYHAQKAAERQTYEDHIGQKNRVIIRLKHSIQQILLKRAYENQKIDSLNVRTRAAYVDSILIRAGIRQPHLP